MCDVDEVLSPRRLSGPKSPDAASPSLHGVQEGLFPRLDDSMRCSDSLPPVSPRFVAFAWRYHPRAWFAPSGRDAQPWAPGSWCSGSRAGNVGGGGRVSQVPGQPLCPYALLLDPGRTEDARPLRRLDMAPARVINEGSRDEKISGLDHTALGLAVYASSWRSPDTTQDSLPAAWPRLAGRDSVTRRVATKGF